MWLILIILTTFLTFSQSTEEVKESFRLNKDAIPKSYSLKLVPNLDNDTFKGEVTILLHTENPIRSIKLNSRGLDINEVNLDQKFNETKYKLNEQLEQLEISFFDEFYINPGEHILHIKFNGSLVHETGFYVRKNRNKKFVATKFSSIQARAAFPCFDEPSFKSIFNIRLVKPNNSWTAISNMKQIGIFNTTDGIAVDFQSTVKMSTYLLAWILTDYSYDEIMFNGKNGKIPLRFYTPEDKINDRKDALNTTLKVLSFFENYTGIPYVLPMLSSIELPYYRSGGMEHWGLIVYRENSVTYNSYSSSPLQHSIYGSLLIAHEVSHMWFGNLVTHEWYNDLWLTEGFARFMQFKAISTQLNLPFIPSYFHHNKLNYLHDMQCDPYNIETVYFPRRNNEIGYKFTPITYDQGGAVLMMLENVLGIEKFQKAIQKHLKAHQFDVSTTGNLMEVIQNEVPDLNIRSMMETYLFQKGLPVVTVEEKNDFYVLKQEPLCEMKPSIFGNKWSIPIRYVTSSNKTSNLIIFDRDMNEVFIPKNKADKWIKINYQNQGLYRTKYSVELFKSLQNNFLEFDSDDKGSLLQDVILLATYKNYPCNILFNLLSIFKYQKDIDLSTFSYLSSSLKYFMSRKNFNKDVRNLINSYIIHIFEPMKQQLGWMVQVHDTIATRLLRTELLDFLCRFIDYKSCIEDVKKLNGVKVHDDVNFVYEAIWKEINSTTTTETSTIQEPQYFETDCSMWIKENIPKLIEEINKI